MIILEHVHKRYTQDQQALVDVSFELKKGELAFLTGHSGAGKSSLLKLLAAMELPSEGNLWVGQTQVNQLKRADIPFFRRRIGIVFQNPLLLPQYTIFDNIALPLILHGFRESDMRRRVQAALSKVGLLKYVDFYPPQLSVGEQQRVGIARAIVHRPEVLLADEPTGNLDPELSLQMMHLFESFGQIGVTVLIATHDQTLIEAMPYRILALREGQLIGEVPAEQPATEQEAHYA